MRDYLSNALLRLVLNLSGIIEKLHPEWNGAEIEVITPHKCADCLAEERSFTLIQ